MTLNHTRWKLRLAVMLAYLIAVFLMALPASLHLDRQMLGNDIDSWIFYWNDWNVERTVVEGQPLLSTPYLFYPAGASLVAHSNSFTNSFLALGLRGLVGPVVAYNGVMLFGLWMSGMGMFLLMYDITRRPAAAFIAGLVFAFAPSHLMQVLAHGNLGSIHWWPFYILFLRRALRERWAVNGIGAGFFAAVTLWSGLHLALLLSLWTVLYLLWAVLLDHRPWAKAARVAALVAGVTCVLGAPLVMPVLEAWGSLASLTQAFEEGLTSQTDLLAYFIPSLSHPVNAWLIDLQERITANAYLGYAALGMAGVALLRRRREASFWLASGACWGILALGVVLTVNGSAYPRVPLPYRWVEAVFPISVIRAPDRFNLLVVLTLAVLVGLGAAHLKERRRWLLVPLTLLVFAEYVPIPISTLDFFPASPFFERMAAEEVRYGVVDYPMGYRPSKQWLYYQTLHGQPIVEGHISRYSDETYAFIIEQPFLRTLYHIALRPLRLPPDTFEGDVIPPSALGPALRALTARNVRYVLAHETFMDDFQRAYLRQVLPVVPVYHDEALTVYDITDPLPVLFGPFPVPLTPGLSLASFSVQHTEDVWEFEMLAFPPAASVAPQTCAVQLFGETGSVSVASVTFFDALPAGYDWHTGDLDVQRVSATLAGALDVGVYHWGVTCGAEMYVSSDILDVYPDGSTTYLRHRSDVLYGETIRLRGYSWQTAGPDLQIALLWEALSPPAGDYKVFVHLLDESGEIVGQYDAVPCAWECPTSGWETGTVVVDQASISVIGLAPGAYRLAVGLYSLETLDRLPAMGPGGDSYPDGVFVLSDLFLVNEGLESSWR
jgi:hypothetical protein